MEISVGSINKNIYRKTGYDFPPLVVTLEIIYAIFRILIK